MAMCTAQVLMRFMAAQQHALHACSSSSDCLSYQAGAEGNTISCLVINPPVRVNNLQQCTKSHGTTTLKAGLHAITGAASRVVSNQHHLQSQLKYWTIPAWPHTYCRIQPNPYHVPFYSRATHTPTLCPLLLAAAVLSPSVTGLTPPTRLLKSGLTRRSDRLLPWAVDTSRTPRAAMVRQAAASYTDIQRACR